MRRQLLLIATAWLLTGPGPAGAAARQADGTSWAPDVSAARSWAQGRTGEVAFRLEELGTGRRWGHRAWIRMKGASTLKTLLLATYLRRGSVRDRPLSAADRKLLEPMIRNSANMPANHLSVALGEDAIRRTARAAGMGTVDVQYPWWGATLTSPRAQVRLMANLERILPPRHRDYAMHLLRTITASQRWGVGRVPLPGWRVYFKGGWGDGSGAVDHQSVLLARGERRIALSIMTRGNASHRDGQRTLEGVARRLLRGL